MSRHTLPLIVFFCWGLVPADSVPAAAPTGMPRAGVLVLRNGEVLHGQIMQAGDRYLVTWSDGGEVRIPATDVEMCCQDLHEVYLRKRSTIELGGVGRRLDLADWCLRHSLLGPAAEELLEATAIDPNHPRIRQLERRLQLAADLPPALVKATPQPESGVSPSDIENRLRELPDAVVERFTIHLQPLLLNRCGANSCHGGTSESAFRLLRPSWGKTMSRRYTQRNLYATLQQVTPQTPEKSPLLKVLGGPHGPLTQPVFSQRDQAQLKLLTEWVKQLARQDVEAAPPTIAPPTSRLLQAAFPASQATPPAQTPETPPAAARNSVPSVSSPPPKRLPDDTYMPRDAFDPEVFNRRYGDPQSVNPK
jgi:hypothetical protein